MGRFTDPRNDLMVKEYWEKKAKEKLALACLWKPREIKEDEYGRYFFDEEHLKKVLESRK